MRTVVQFAAGLGRFALWSVAWGIALFLPPAIAVVWVPAVAAAFLWTYAVRTRRPGRSRMRATLRLRGLGPGAPWVVLGAVPLAAFWLAWNVVYRSWVPGGAPPPEEIARLGADPLGRLALALVGLAVAPLIEEFVFRGWLQRPLERCWGAGPAITASAALFAVAHFEWWWTPGYFLGGLMLGYAVHAARSIWAGVLLHVAHNAALMAVTLRFADLQAFGRWVVEWAGPGLAPAVLVGSGALLLWLGAELRRSHARRRGAARRSRWTPREAHAAG